MNFNIEKFNPRIKELEDLKEVCEKLVMSDGNAGYDLIKSTRITLKNKRCEIVNEFTADRAIANSYANANIALQKKLVGIIEPLEKKLEDKQKAIDLETFVEKQKEKLPERIKRLEEINVKLKDREILVMKDTDFEMFYTSKKAEFLEQKEIAIKEEQERQKQKDIENEREKQRLIDMENARKEEAEKAKKQAEIDKINAEKEKELALKKAEEDKRIAIENEKRKAEEEKQKIIAEQKRVEEERLAKIESEKKVEEERLQKEKEEAEKLEKKKKYINFLKINGYTEKNKDDYKAEWNGNTVILWKKIGVLKV